MTHKQWFNNVLHLHPVHEEGAKFRCKRMSSKKKNGRVRFQRPHQDGFRAVGGGHAATSKLFSFLGLLPINKNSCADHTKKIEREARILLELSHRVIYFLTSSYWCQTPIVRAR